MYKNPIFRYCKMRGAIKTGGWVGSVTRDDWNIMSAHKWSRLK